MLGNKELRDIKGRVQQKHADGIAIDSSGKYFYLLPRLDARPLYRIKTSVLKKSALSEEQLARYVEKVADIGAVDGMLMNADYNPYYTALKNFSIKRYQPEDVVIDI